ncbi:carbohydrate-binding module family 1 protein [Artomyces pyxidatus]|uniref:Carbohydrate-binding module family 1 protein n=1 Tax=Artomyces pyxidatus TaxID=48021 RepID=A0ACB8SZX9_9AGAM|nr:carbohydrate-binding module family 1 protein [Artomyces pyxidatus]
MYHFAALAALSLLARTARGGTTIWSGSFNNYPTVSAFDNWSWSDEVGEYQWYIHGTQPTSHYLALSPTYKNPADTAETNGLRITIDSTATWNSQMERAELIPQTTANLGQGNLFYHFSISTDSTSPPESTLEHQIFFFESHFTELKYGVGPNSTYLEWHVSSQPQWGVALVPGTWYNFAYDIDFSGNTVGLWFSEGGNPLTKVHANVAASTSTNSEDFHVGVLRIVNDAHAENYYVSGVYIESGPITTTIGSGTGGSSPSSSPASSSTITPTTAPSSAPTTSTVSTTSSAPAPAQTKYGQCGGTSYTGPTSCVSGTTCVAVSPPYYYQCQ